MLPLASKVLDSINRGDDPVEEGRTEIQWPLIEFREEKWKTGECHTEPGESEEFRYDFVVDQEVQTVRVYSYFKNITQRRREKGWGLVPIPPCTEEDV